MLEEKEISEQKKYRADLKLIMSELTQILDKGTEKDISRAARHYPAKLNQLLAGRNIKSASGIIPFFDLAFIHQRRQNIDLVDLNSKKDDADLLWDVIRRIERELDL